jgi:hypothetical protein
MKKKPRHTATAMKVKCLRCGQFVSFEKYKVVGACTNHKCIDSRRTYDPTDYQKKKETV